MGSHSKRKRSSISIAGAGRIIFHDLRDGQTWRGGESAARRRARFLGGQPRKLDRGLVQGDALLSRGVEPPVSTGFDEDDHDEHSEYKSDGGVQPVVEDQALGFDEFGRRNRAGGDLVGKLRGMGQETQFGDGAPDLLVAGGHGGGHVPNEGTEGDHYIARLAHLDQDGRAYAQRDSGQELVGNTEERPQAVDASQRVNNSL